MEEDSLTQSCGERLDTESFPKKIASLVLKTEYEIVRHKSKGKEIPGR